MSEDEQRSEKKDLLLEWTENNQELERRRAVAAKMADTLRVVAGVLETNPERLLFSEDKASLKAMDKELRVNDASGLDVSAIQSVRDAIRELLERQEKLKPRMKAFNLPI